MRALLLAVLLGVAPAYGQAPLPDTKPLTFDGDPAARMVDAIHAYLERETVTARERRTAIPDRDAFRKIIGAVDQRLPASGQLFDSAAPGSPEVARGPRYRAYAVRWPVFDGVDAEGLLLEPDAPPKARIVAIPDAGVTPEKFAPARRLAQAGCQVLIPVLIDRSDTWSGIPAIRMTNQPHREWIYRMAFEAGRHIIGYEVQKVLAAVDWFEKQTAPRALPIAVAGDGEGGLLALYAAALDPRISATLVSAYFQPRDQLWKEPIYRDVWGLLRHYGDAEIAGMIAPRALIVEASRAIEVAGPPPATRERRGAAPVGAIVSPPIDDVRAEVDRARRYHPAVQLVTVNGTDALLKSLGLPVTPAGAPTPDLRPDFDPVPRARRQFDQLVAHTQSIVRHSNRTRAAFWSRADPSSPAKWQASTKPMRDHIWNEVIGRLPDPSAPADPRSRLIYDEPKYRGYEVMLDVWPGVFAYGILLVPKDIRPGEKRPVVVCQHGLEGRPRDLADPKIDNPAYHRYAVRLAEEGFVTFSPQNPYIGQDRFRQIQRKGHPLKLSLFSFILGQHQRILEWLGGLDFVDPQRIGFYGLSYGGKTAVRVPPLLDGYALSICSADFNEWVWKTTSVDASYSYMLTQEYDMLEFDFANVVNYSDLANLMAPRPFMVERGHDDGVAPDEWVAYEFAKVRRFYTKLGLPERTEIEFFNGPHTINGVGTFAFLRRHLQFPK
jgi:dienelactone hydrolase